MPRVRRYNYRWLAHLGYQAWKRTKPNLIAVDTETTGLRFFDYPFCVTIAWRGQSHFFDLSVSAPAVAEMLLQTPLLVFHNAKFDCQKLILSGLLERERLKPEWFHDTEFIAHLLNPHRPKGLKDLAKSILGKETDEAQKLAEVRRKLKLTKDAGYDKLPREVLVPYAKKDAEFTYKLFHRLLPQLMRTPDLPQLYLDEKQLILRALDMEAAGMGVDGPYVQEQIKAYGTKILRQQIRLEKLIGKKVGKEAIKLKEPIVDEWGSQLYGSPTKKFPGGRPRYRTVEKPHPDFFNPNSTAQVMEVFAGRGHFITDTKESTLQKLDDPVARALLDYRGYQKIRSTYLMPMRDESRDGVLHPNFNLTGTVTGRWSSSGARE